MSAICFVRRPSSVLIARNILRRQGKRYFWHLCPSTSNTIFHNYRSKIFHHRQLRYSFSAVANDLPSQSQEQSSSSSTPLPDQIDQEHQKWMRILEEKEGTVTELDSSGFLKKPTDWVEMPGYKAMLCAYGVEIPDPGTDPVEQVASPMSLNPVQKDAIAAVLNPNRPLVTVHGAAGTGKSALLVECARLLSIKQAKRIAIVSASKESIYSLIGKYLKSTKNCENFVHLQPYDEEMALRLVPKCIRNKVTDSQNADIRKMISKRSLVELMRKKGVKIPLYDLLRSASAKDQTQVVFATPGDLADLLENLAITSNGHPPPFDVILLDDANFMHELDTWRLVLQMAPLVRVFFDNSHFTPSFQQTDSQNSLQENFQRPFLHRLRYETPQLSFALPFQYRSNGAIHIWSFRFVYKDADSFATPVTRPGAKLDVRMDDLLNRLVISGDTLDTNPFLIVDTSRLDGKWTESMFRPIQLPSSSQNATSFINWGEAFLVASHLNALLQFGADPSLLASFSHITAQCDAIRRILFCMNPSLKFHYERVEIGRVEQYLGREFECVATSFVTDPSPYLNNSLNLQYFSLQILRAKRQVVLIAPCRRLLQMHTHEAYGLIRLAQDRGNIVTPNELFRLEQGQFEHIVREAGQGWAKKQSETEKREEERRTMAQKVVENHQFQSPENERRTKSG